MKFDYDKNIIIHDTFCLYLFLLILLELEL